MSEIWSLQNDLVQYCLPILLQDKTTKENIIFATDNYKVLGDDFSEESQITVEKLRDMGDCEIQPRVMKSLEAQKLRTKVKAEVMTPGWIVCKMNGYADEEWFGRPNVFEVLDGTSWSPTEGHIEFPKGKNWKEYVDSRRIEITCGEAPYIVSRYDVTTGDIIPLAHRTGLLDRKLRIVNENAAIQEEWLKWAERAFQSVYGYEWQGDNLLIARVNLLNTYMDYLENAWHRQPAKREIKKIANIIAWNIWQMDGFTGTIPYAEPEKEHEEVEQFSLDGFFDTIIEDKPKNIKCYLIIYKIKICPYHALNIKSYTNVKSRCLALCANTKFHAIF